MQTLRKRLGFRPILRPDEKEDFFKWVTNPDPVVEKEMEDIVKSLKGKEKSFIFTWKPDEQEKEMTRKTREEEMFGEPSGQEQSYETPQFITNVETGTLRQSLRELQKECLEETKKDIKEISRKRKQLFKQVADLHVKESLLVARQRAVQLESAILDETD